MRKSASEKKSPAYGHPGTRELGPSDLSDTGSDMVGAAGVDDDSDAAGTGEGRDAGGAVVPEGRDLAPDHLVDDEEERGEDRDE